MIHHCIIKEEGYLLDTCRECGRVFHHLKLKSQRQGRALEVMQELLDYLIDYKCDHGGNSPSFHEIADFCGMRTTSLVSYYLDKLEKMNLVTRIPGTARTISVVGWELTKEA